MANQVKLWCLLFPENNLNHMFSIKIDSDEEVALLKKMIKLKNLNKLDYVGAPDLELWKCCIPFGDGLNATLDSLRWDGTDDRLEPLITTFTVEDGFPEQPPAQNLHVIVKLPPGQPPPKRARLGSPVSQQGRKEAGAPSNMIEFDGKIWGKRDVDRDVFKVKAIMRGDPPSSVLIPDECCVMTSPRYASGSRYLEGIFIRNEYIQAVKDIDAFYKGRDFAPNDDIPEESDDKTDTMMQGDEADMTIQGDDPGPEVDARMNTSVDAAESSVDPVAFPITIPNPFLDRGFPVELKRLGVIITGTPGIGKSVLLEFILHLRSLAGLPTVFVKEKDRADLFTSSTVTRLYRSEIQDDMLLPSTWILVDSNQDLTDVPEWVLELGCFIVQAASQRQWRMEWQNKIPNVSQYFLKPWSVEEVLSARMLQALSPPSELELETFCERYAPSARTAFSYAWRLSTYEYYIDSKIRDFSVEILTMMDGPSSIKIDDDKLPHQIFVFRPGRARDRPLVQFATQYLTDKVFDALRSKRATATQELFEVFSRDKSTKGAAGQLLDRVIKDIFARGLAENSSNGRVEGTRHEVPFVNLPRLA